MVEYAYTTVTGKIKPLLEKIRTVGIPPKVTIQWLMQIGLKSTNDRSLIPILKYIGLIDSSGTPTPRWSEYRGANHKQVLGNAIRQGYADLFALYPDANARSVADITHVFSTSSSGGQQVIAKTVQTFRALVEEASFEGGWEAASTLEAGPLHTPAVTEPSLQRSNSNPPGASLHIDIQIHISPESNAEQIDQIFASMAKHLYGAKTG
ncbi:MAG: DUF5343 domain-containing protein [Pseudomonadota bacterium]